MRSERARWLAIAMMSPPMTIDHAPAGLAAAPWWW